MIIAFTGRIRSGKSTACDLLVKRGYEVINFADPLKEMTAKLLDIPLEWCYNQEEKEKERSFIISTDEFCTLLANEGLHPSKSLLSRHGYIFASLREVLQFVGSELFRESDKNFWVNKLMSKIDFKKKYAIGDARFLNEIQAVKNVGGSVVFISRPAIVSTSTHQSEQIDDLPYDFKITNTDLAQFKKDIVLIEELICDR